MKEYYSSFFSEHTAEFTLVPKLVSILRKKYKYVVPIFPWLSREGNSLSKSIHNNDRFKTIGLYPKRPKLNLQSNKILVKINDEFLRGAEYGLTIGIPIIAGCPIVKSFWELNSNDAECLWLKLTDRTMEYYEVEYDEKKTLPQRVLQKDELLITEEDLINFVDSNTRELEFGDLITAIREIKRVSTTISFMGFGTYKPIYFLLRDEIGELLPD